MSDAYVNVHDAEPAARIDEREGGLLAGLRVLDLSVWRPGPYATQLLGELGADVIKVEPPGGDPMRAYPELFASLNARKRGIVLDLKSDAGRRRALELAADADVVVEGFRPGVVRRLGVGYDDVLAVNPSIIYCSLSGMGQTGPLSAVPGHDLNFLAWSGALAPDGGIPAEPAIPVADLAGGMAAALAICAAAVRRAATREGERIDLAMADVLATWTGSAEPRSAVSARRQEGRRQEGRRQNGVAGYGVFETADGRYLTLGIVSEDHFWRALCDVLGLAELRGLSYEARMDRSDELQARVTEMVRRYPCDRLVDALLVEDVPAAPVLDRREMLTIDHFRTRGIVRPGPRSSMLGHPVRFSHHPALGPTRAPRLDEHRGTAFSGPGRAR